MTDKPNLETLAERVRERLIQNGQHGALAEFQKYTAAVDERHDALLRQSAGRRADRIDLDASSVGATGTADGTVEMPVVTGAIANESASKPAKPRAKKTKGAGK